MCEEHVIVNDKDTSESINYNAKKTKIRENGMGYITNNAQLITY